MATYNKIIKIKKLDNENEKYNDFFSCHAEINKASGKEYYNASTNITNSTLNFKMRYCKKLKEIPFNLDKFIIYYDGNYFDIKNYDNKNLNNDELILVGEYNGTYNFN